MDYSRLPDVVLKKIATDHLETHSQHIAFSQVCKSWRSTATVLLRRRRHVRGRPGLLISHKSKPPLRTPLEFFPIGNSTLPLIPTRPSLWPPPPPPPPATKAERKLLNRRLQEQSSSSVASFNAKLARNQCVGSKDGWLLLLYPGNRRRKKNTFLFSFYLYNPMTARHVSLPDLILDKDDHDEKEPPIIRTVISSSPDDELDCHVFIVFPHTLAWSTVDHRGGGQNWKLIALRELGSYNTLLDASYFGGKFFLVSDVNRLIVVDLFSKNDNIHHTNNMIDNKKQIAVRPSSKMYYLSQAMTSRKEDESWFTHLCHLDERDQLPLVIISRCNKGNDRTIAFRVYKLVILPNPKQRGGSSGESGYDWEEVTSLNGYSVFVGSHQSFAIHADDGDGVNYGVGANRIYFSFCFAENGLYMDHEMFWSSHQNNCGVFKLDGGEVEWFNPSRHLGDHNYVWFLPMPWDILTYMHESKAKKPDRKLRVDDKII